MTDLNALAHTVSHNWLFAQ